LDLLAIIAEGTQPVAGEIREKVVEPFIAALCVALGEMANTEVVVRAVYRKRIDQTLTDLTAVVEFLSATEEALVLHFPEQTAAALAGRILAGVKQEVEESLVRDCVGEIANVVAGQAKALLAGTPHRLTFSLPRVVVGAGHELRPGQDLDCLIVTFQSEVGDFAMQLFLKR
jgi:chemotaxis protein CheX